MIFYIACLAQLTNWNKIESVGLKPLKGNDTLESFLSKVTLKSNLPKKLSRIEHVLIVKVYF